MKYVFFGTPRFAAIVLEKLMLAGAIPVAVVTNPDRPAGRKKTLTTPPVKLLASKNDAPIEILQPEKLDSAFMKKLEAIDPDFFVVAAYAKIIPRSILSIPRKGALGVHPSLLPLHRGPSPIQSAILEGDAKTGVSIYQMDEKMDHGPVYSTAEASLDSLKTNYAALEKQLAEMAAELFLEELPKIEAGMNPRIQDENKATYTKKFVTEDAFIEERDLLSAQNGNAKAAEKIIRKINAFSGEPGAWTMRNGKRIKLLGGSITNGALKLSKLQEEGQKPRRI